MVVDFAPGQDHIFLRRDGLEYYVPELFHLSQCFNQSCPIMIHDIHNLQKLTDIYGARGLTSQKNGIIMINNHPLRNMTLFGKIVGEKFKEFDDSLKNFVILTIDDCTGTNLMLDVLLNIGVFSRAGLRIDETYGMLVEIRGHLKHFRNKLEFVGEYAECKGDSSNLEIQISYWKAQLNFKKLLLDTCWVYKPAGEIELKDPIPPFMNDERQMIIDIEGLKGKSKPLQQPQVATLPDDIIVISDDEENNSSSADNYSSYEESNNWESAVVVTEFQITFEIIRYFLANSFKDTKLINLYNDAKINALTGELTKSRLQLHATDPVDFTTLKYDSFHLIRHKLQTELKLFVTTKSQLVKPKNLQSLCLHIDGCLMTIRESKGVKVFNVENYIRIFKSQNPTTIGSINAKLVNSIIELLLVKFGDRDQWRYQARLVEWLFIWK